MRWLPIFELDPRALIEAGNPDRELHLFDTVAGMLQPGAVDLDFAGRSAAERLHEHSSSKSENPVWLVAPRQGVSSNMTSTGYPADLVPNVKGKVDGTLPSKAPAPDALLRLDAGCHEGARHEFFHLWPRLFRGRVLKTNDYGYWKGVRKAVNEYLQSISDPVLRHRIGDTGRAAVRR